jgi:hypothetical protein
MSICIASARRPGIAEEAHLSGVARLRLRSGFQHVPSKKLPPGAEVRSPFFLRRRAIIGDGNELAQGNETVIRACRAA